MNQIKAKLPNRAVDRRPERGIISKLMQDRVLTQGHLQTSVAQLDPWYLTITYAHGSYTDASHMSSQTASLLCHSVKTCVTNHLVLDLYNLAPCVRQVNPVIVQARKDSDQPERWNNGPAPDSWRGPPGLHGRGPGPEGRERQWGGRGSQPPPPAEPVEMHRAPLNRPPDR